MTELEYIKATNQAKATIAVNAIRDIMAGDRYGVDAGKYSQAYELMCEIQQGLFDTIPTLEESP